MATDAKVNPEQLLAEINDRLRKNTAGTYGETAIAQGIREYKNLDKLASDGSLSNADYVNISDAIREYLVPIGGASTRGKAGAIAVTNQGWYDIQNNYRNAEIYRNASQMLGRDITSQEFAQVAPRFGTGSARDIEVGRAYLAELAQQEANSPSKLAEKAPQYSGQVNDIFSNLLKRGASQSELDHFGKLMATGEVDAYTLNQFVQQLPEYTDARSQEALAKQTEEDKLAREQLGSELQGYDQEFFNKGKENIISRYAQAGIQNSPSLDFALTNLMGDIQKERSAYLADIGRRDYESARGFKREDLLANRGMARQDYETNLNRLFGQQDYGQQRSDAYSDLLTNRSFGSIDYQRQQDDLMRLLSQQGSGRRSSSMGSLIGGLAGAGIGGFATRSPQGASAGYQIGSGVGGGYDYLNS